MPVGHDTPPFMVDPHPLRQRPRPCIPARVRGRSNLPYLLLTILDRSQFPEIYMLRRSRPAYCGAASTVYQHRDPGLGEHLLRLAAQQGGLEAMAAMRGDEDEVA